MYSNTTGLFSKTIGYGAPAPNHTYYRFRDHNLFQWISSSCDVRDGAIAMDILADAHASDLASVASFLSVHCARRTASIYARR